MTSDELIKLIHETKVCWYIYYNNRICTLPIDSVLDFLLGRTDKIRILDILDGTIYVDSERISIYRGK